MIPRASIQAGAEGGGPVRAAGPGAGWSRGRWVAVIVLLFAVQWAALQWGIRTPVAAAPAVRRGVGMSWLTDPGTIGWVAAAPWVSSPRQFVVLQDGAFSRAAERTLPRTSYQLMEWNLPPRWLDASRVPWGAAPDPGSPASAASRAPRSGRVVSGAAPLPLRERSTVELDPAGAARLEDSGGELPVWRGVEMTGPSRLEALVGPAGQVLSVRLRETSGHRPADEAAVARATALRFRPLPPVPDESPWDPERLQWVQLRFRWQVLPGAVTNGAGPAVR